MVRQIILHTTHSLKECETITHYFFWETNTHTAGREKGVNPVT